MPKHIKYTTDQRSSTKTQLQKLQEELIICQLCPRLVDHRQKIAQEKRKSFRHWTYWGKPVPSFGQWNAKLLILGLAPAAHGANRTGRMFTGDRSGDFLYDSLHRFGFCNQSSSQDRDDGLKLSDTFISAALHCAPPTNKPTPGELENCHPYLLRELLLLKYLQVVICLGHIAWKTYLKARKKIDWPVPHPLPKFKHGAHYKLDKRTILIASYHPSQQNTQTGRLTKKMFDSIFKEARQHINVLSGKSKK